VSKADGGDWLVSQPLATDTLSAPFPAEHDDWGSGNAITLVQPVVVNVDAIVPVVADTGSAGAFAVNVQNLAVLDPSAGPPAADAGTATLTIGSSVYFTESAIFKGIRVLGGAPTSAAGFSNCDVEAPVFDGTAGATLTFWGGQDGYGSLTANGAVLDGDFALGGGVSASSALDGPTLGSVFLDQGVVCALGSNNALGAAASPMVLWGAGALDVLGTTQLQYPAGATAAQTFLLTGGLFLDGDEQGLLQGTNTAGATACSVGTSGTAGWTCGIALTAANLDKSVSLGGFGGNAVNPGGGSVTNHGSGN
jgi:hypothetical protein